MTLKKRKTLSYEPPRHRPVQYNRRTILVPFMQARASIIPLCTGLLFCLLASPLVNLGSLPHPLIGYPRSPANVARQPENGRRIRI